MTIWQHGVKDAWLFDWEKQKWSRLPDMSAARGCMVCALFTDTQGKQKIMTAGEVTMSSFISFARWSRPISTNKHIEKALFIAILTRANVLGGCHKA
jgi:hypothetical protein